MSQDTATQRIKAFVQPHFAGHDLADTEDIFLLGYVNSLFAIQLVAFLEREFGIQMASEDLEFDNFRTLRAIGKLVEYKTTPAQ